MNNPIFILGAHKSGSSLLRNLFDSHQNLFVLPIENHFFQYSGYWNDYFLRSSRPKKMTNEEIITNFYVSIKNSQTYSNSMSDSEIIGKINVDVYNQCMKKLNPKSLKEIILSHVKSLYEAIHKQPYPKELRFVEKSIDHAEYAFDLKTMFPEAKFIHIVRNPYSNVVALRRYLSVSSNNKYPFLKPIFASLKNSYYFLYRNKKLIKEDYQIVRYEDLVENPEDTMREIAEFVNIEFTDSLLKPTSLGNQWYGNSSRNIKHSGVNKNNLEYWKKEINHLELYLVNNCFNFILRDYDYLKTKKNRNLWRRIKSERIKVYILNRFQKYYLY